VRSVTPLHRATPAGPLVVWAMASGGQGSSITLCSAPAFTALLGIPVDVVCGGMFWICFTHSTKLHRPPLLASPPSRLARCPTPR